MNDGTVYRLPRDFACGKTRRQYNYGRGRNNTLKNRKLIERVYVSVAGCKFANRKLEEKCRRRLFTSFSARFCDKQNRVLTEQCSIILMT
ncbi:MAG: hypothetical protein ACTTKL_03165 [Treponema sp.]